VLGREGFLDLGVVLAFLAEVLLVGSLEPRATFARQRSDPALRELTHEATIHLRGLAYLPQDPDEHHPQAGVEP